MAQLSPTSALSVRANLDERALLDKAAEQAHTNLSDLICRKALEESEAGVLNQTVVTIPAKDWASFKAWLGRPAEPIPALAVLMARTPTWER